LDGNGRKDPKSAAAISPSSEEIGSCTVTRKTLLGRSKYRREKNNETYVPVPECAFDLNFVQERRNRRQDMASPKEDLPKLHEICHRVSSIANAFLKLGSDESSCFGLIQAKTSRQSALSKKAELSAIMND